MDSDIDKANPLADLAGLVTHLFGELGVYEINHLVEVRNALATKAATKPYVQYYGVDLADPLP
jgi:hypothetical protein